MILILELPTPEIWLAESGRWTDMLVYILMLVYPWSSDFMALWSVSQECTHLSYCLTFSSVRYFKGKKLQGKKSMHCFNQFHFKSRDNSNVLGFHLCVTILACGKIGVYVYEVWQYWSLRVWNGLSRFSLGIEYPIYIFHTHNLCWNWVSIPSKVLERYASIHSTISPCVLNLLQLLAT